MDGNESDRLNRQIAQLEGWVASKAEPLGVKKWATMVIDSMKRRRATVLEEEAEGAGRRSTILVGFGAPPTVQSTRIDR